MVSRMDHVRRDASPAKRQPTPLALVRRLALVCLGLASAGCDLGLPAGRTPHAEGNRLDMIDQPKLTPQRADVFAGRPTGMMEPPPGAVAIDEQPYAFTQVQPPTADTALVNPLERTPDALAHGKFVYENVCITCHGPRGAGDGHLTLLFPKPPSLMTQRVRDWSDGEIYHRPMRGQGSMPSHARQLDARDIWSVVHYIRQMQASQPVAPPAPTPAPPGASAAGASATAPGATATVSSGGRS